MPNEPVQPNFNTGRKGPMPVVREKVQLENAWGTLFRICRYLLEKKGIVVIVFLCAIISTLVTIIGTRLNGYVVDAYIVTGDLHGLFLLCMILLGMYVVGAVSSYGQNILMIKVSQRTSASIRKDLFHRVQQLPLAYYDTHSSGDLMSRLTNDVDNVNNALSQGVVQLFTSIMNIIGMLLAMLLLSPILTLVALITIPMTYLVSKSIAKLAQRYYIAQQRDMGVMNGYIEEMISGEKLIKLFSQEEEVMHTFTTMNEMLIKHSLRAQSFSSMMGPCNHMVNNLAYLAVAVAGGVCAIQNTQTITVGIIFSFLLYMRNFTNPINNILNLVNTLQLALASGERVFQVMDEDIETDEEGAIDVDDIQGNIDMQDIQFSYLPGQPVLKHADIAATHGQTIAIVGPTGAGKTTIINLLNKFYDIDDGRILIDGVDIQHITRGSLRKSISMVLQDTFLFSDSIMENIRYGRLNASDDEVIQAAQAAHAHEFIMQLNNGYQTILSDNGKNLSQGQRQLLSIARAILSNAEILVLDEATSCIDTRTEQLIQRALLKLMEGKTSFVIAHRLSTIRNADQILVLEDGFVVEKGCHEELIRRQGAYANLYNSQFKGKQI